MCHFFFINSVLPSSRALCIFAGNNSDDESNAFSIPSLVSITTHRHRWIILCIFMWSFE
uniref:Uncharacterized protein n=1 Tax=Setaria viridis TaxID=4556 RepID=A0A4U6WAD0_SETVI|nr:hypothetical protein SEVIR_1G124050v2 [Setaria viridis]